MDNPQPSGRVLGQALFLAKKYVAEINEPVECYTNGHAVMIRAQADSPNPIENEDEEWTYLGLVEND